MLLRREKKKENTSNAINNAVTPVTLCTVLVRRVWACWRVCLWTRARATFFHRSQLVLFACECVHAAGSCGQGRKRFSLFGVCLCGTVSRLGSKSAAKPPRPRRPRTEEISLNSSFKQGFLTTLTFMSLPKTAGHGCTSRAARQQWSHPKALFILTYLLLLLYLMLLFVLNPFTGVLPSCQKLLSYIFIIKMEARLTHKLYVHITDFYLAAGPWGFSLEENRRLSGTENECEARAFPHACALL